MRFVPFNTQSSILVFSKTENLRLQYRVLGGTVKSLGSRVTIGRTEYGTMPPVYNNDRIVIKPPCWDGS